jgi:hypothetical protein
MCDAYDMSYYKRETKHKKVCAVWGKTSKTGFTQSVHETGKLKKQLIQHINMHHNLTLSYLEIFRVHFTHCCTQYKSSQVQHIDKVQ